MSHYSGSSFGVFKVHVEEDGGCKHKQGQNATLNFMISHKMLNETLGFINKQEESLHNIDTATEINKKMASNKPSLTNK